MDDVLMPTARLPAMSSTMPESFRTLLSEWESRELESFRVFRWQAGDQALRQAYTKRLYLYDAITRHPIGATLELKAASLDSIRRVQARKKDRSMTGYLRLLKSEDDTLVRRVKRTRPPSPARQPRAAPAAPVRNTGGAGGRGGRGQGGRGQGGSRIRIVGDNGRLQRPAQFLQNMRMERPTWENTNRTSNGRDHR